MMRADAASGEGRLIEDTDVFTQIVVYDGEHIIGYTVLHFIRLTYRELGEAFYEELNVPLDQYANSFRLEVVTSVSFPKVNGEYQNVTMEDVNQYLKLN